MIPSIVTTKWRGKEEPLHMYHDTAENLEECIVFFAGKTKMYNLETAGCLFQVSLSFMILSKFRCFNDKVSYESLCFNEV